MSLPEWMGKGQKGPVDGETLLEITKGRVVYVLGGYAIQYKKKN